MADKIKTLSQAIRLGATFRPQCRFSLFLDGKSCALGAAFEALTGVGDTDGYMKADVQSAGTLFQQRFGSPNWLLKEVEARNDSGSTREDVAAWLESQGL